MLKYMLRRVLQMIPVLFIITIITFLFVNASGDPTAMLLPPEATAADREVLREALGLNEPLYVQYGIFIKNALHGDFGTSFRYGTSAMSVVMEKNACHAAACQRFTAVLYSGGHSAGHSQRPYEGFAL